MLRSQRSTLQAVDSEHNKNIYEDNRREFQLLRSTTCEGQPLRQYGSGNAFTLSRPAHAAEISRIVRPRHFESHADLPGEMPAGAASGEVSQGAAGGGGGIAAQLRAFWEANYSAHTMKLAVVAPFALDQLQDWVAKFFSAVPRRSIVPMQGVQERWGAGGCLAAFGDEWFQIYRIVPVKESRALKLFFPLPPVVGGEARRDDPHAKWRAKRERLLSFCIGHEGRGSILSLLKRKGWATGLSAGTSFTTRFVAIFKIDVNLTPAGLTHHRQVEAAVCAYISGCLRRDSVPLERQRVYSEMRMAKEMRFTLMDRVNPEAYVQGLSRNLEHYPPDMLLDGPELFHEPEVDLAALDHLLDTHFSKYRVHLVAPEGELPGDAEANAQEELELAGGDERAQAGGGGWLYERWYGAQYRKLQGPAADERAGEPSPSVLEALSLPEANQYLPEALDLTLPLEGEPFLSGGGDESAEDLYVPRLVRLVRKGPAPVAPAVERIWVWHLPDVSFGTPKAFVAVHISSWEGNECAADSGARRMMVNILEDVCNEEVYEAGEAGLSAKIGDRHGSPYPGVRLAVKGYSNKLGRLLLWLCRQLVSLDVTNMPDTFERVQRRTVQNLLNHRHDKAYEHCAAMRSAELVSPSFQWKDKADAVAACTPAFLQSFIARFLSTATLRVLIAGDIAWQGAAELSVQVASTFGVAGEGDVEAVLAGDMAEGAQAFPRDMQEQLGEELLHKLHREKIPVVAQLRDGDERRVTQPHPDGGKSADSAVDIYFDCGASSAWNDVMVEVVAQILDKAFFAQLRTVEQLGYIVGAGAATNHAAAALVFRVQSVKAWQELEGRIDAFLSSFRDTVQELTSERLEQLKTALVMRKREPDKSIESRALRMMNEVCALASQGTFYRRSNEIAALGRIQLDDVKSFYDRFLLPSSSSRRRLVCSIVGGAVLGDMNREMHVSSPSSSTLPMAAGRSSTSSSITGEAASGTGAGGQTPVAAQAGAPAVPQRPDCGVHTVALDSRSTYTGSWRGGLRHGEGTMVWSSGKR